MTQGPLVSIVTPFLNVEAFIGQAIESVLAQTYDRWELLLVDDGSTDASTGIARRYAERHPDKLRYVEHERHRNLGASASRNVGRRHASGEYIAYLDADDVWLPCKLEQQVALLKAYPDAGMILGATEYWYSWTGLRQDADRDVVVPVGGPQDTLVQPPRLLKLLYPLGRGTAPSMNTVLVRADVVDQVGGWEDSFRVAYTDQAFLVKIYLAAPVYIASQCGDRYRQRSDSSMHTALAGAGYDTVRLQFLEWFATYLLDRGLTNTEAWSLLQRAIWPYRHPVLNRAAQFCRRTANTLMRSVS